VLLHKLSRRVCWNHWNHNHRRGNRDRPWQNPRDTSDTKIATRICKCLADIKKWTTANHIKLNIDKTQLLFMLGKYCPQMDLLVAIEDIKVSPLLIARNFGMALDNQLCCNSKHHNPALPHMWSSTDSPCAHHHSPQLLQLSPGWTPCHRNQTLTTHPECSSRPNLPKFSHVTPLFRYLHWLPVITRTTGSTFTKNRQTSHPLWSSTTDRHKAAASAHGGTLCSRMTVFTAVPVSSTSQTTPQLSAW